MNNNGSPQLHSLLAVLPTKKGAAEKITNETKRTFADKQQHFDETLRSYQPALEGGQPEPDEHSPAATTVRQKLNHFFKVFGPFIDVGFQIDRTNCEAKADITIGDKVIAAQVPSTFLMQLDGRLTDIRSVLDAMPTLDPKFVWTPDEDKGEGVFQAGDETRYRTDKKPRFEVVTEATEFHPAQYERINEETRIGTYTTKRWSGKITPSQKADMISRVDELHAAVKRARAKANQTDHSKDKISEDIAQFILGDLK